MLKVSKFAVCHWETCARFPRPAILRRIERVTKGEVDAACMFAAYQAHHEKLATAPEVVP